MPRSARSRSIGAMMVLSALALVAVASPASAAGKTRWVDDDGKAGSTSCSGSGTAYKKIQSAVTASAAGDTVKVCPGTYVGKVTIKGSRNGLVLRSTSALGATIKAVDEYGSSPDFLVTIDDVDDVTVKGFKIRALQPTSHNYCSASTGVRADPCQVRGHQRQRHPTERQRRLLRRLRRHPRHRGHHRHHRRQRRQGLPQQRHPARRFGHQADRR